VEVRNTLAYCSTEFITGAKSFMAQAPCWRVKHNKTKTKAKQTWMAQDKYNGSDERR